MFKYFIALVNPSTGSIEMVSSHYSLSLEMAQYGLNKTLSEYKVYAPEKRVLHSWIKEVAE